ncbi:MAG TPA: glycosyltransferase family A protein, partial [Tepidisphaeraceae bacterium]|nr:glycosyltransferase family A protein [Tepidisphaeraceae bacterium]
MSCVDVVIPCYKYAHFLRGCIQSVLSQDGVDVRVLIIDDCSPDNTAEIGSQLAQEDPRVEFRRHEVNRGHIATYNEGLLEWAGGDFTMILSADDLLVPGALRRAAKVMTDHPEVGMTFGNYLEFDADLPSEANAVRADDSYPVKIYSHAEFLAFACNRGQTGIAAPTAVVRTEVQRRVGGYIPALPHSGDTEMWLRLSHHSGVA